MEHKRSNNCGELLLWHRTSEKAIRVLADLAPGTHFEQRPRVVREETRERQNNPAVALVLSVTAQVSVALRDSKLLKEKNPSADRRSHPGADQEHRRYRQERYGLESLRCNASGDVFTPPPRSLPKKVR